VHKPGFRARLSVIVGGISRGGLDPSRHGNLMLLMLSGARKRKLLDLSLPGGRASLIGV
jgi:hypothetical protein